MTRKKGASADIAGVKCCRICGRRLSIYNNSEYCHRHSPEERERAGFNLKPSESPPATNTAGIPSPEQKKAQAIIELVYEVFNIPVSEVGSLNRLGPIGEARRVTAYLLSEDLGLELSEIGRYLRRNAKSVRISVSHIKESVEGKNSSVCEKIATIRSRYPQSPP